MRILVIGSEGFIGRHLMEQGLLLGHSMSGVDIVGDPDFKVGAEHLHPSILRDFDRVIHSAGVLGTSETILNPVAAVESNINCTLRVLEQCRIAGCDFTYLTLGNRWLNPYSITKNCAADFVEMYGEVHEMRTHVAICYNVFGPYQKWEPVRKIVPEFMTRLIARKPIQLFFGGNQIVDMCYAPDVAASIIQSHTYGRVHYGSSRPVTVQSVLDACASSLNIKDFTVEDVGPRPGETGRAAIAPYPMPYITNFDKAMDITAKWYADNFIPGELNKA